MFCKAITTKGCPCISQCKTGANFCKNHNIVYPECYICLDDLTCKVTLKCGHYMCVNCIHNICDYTNTIKCPFCRKNSKLEDNIVIEYGNKITKTTPETINKIISLIKSLNDSTNEIKVITTIFNETFKNHSLLFALNEGVLINVLKNKLNELSYNMNVQKYQKQLSSYINRVSICEKVFKN